jgi:acetoin:2,6-dichlorophenolindophenol oxidoreductase subunit alpha
MSLANTELLRAYRLMRTIRDFEEGVNVEFMGGAIPGFVHLYAGQEASAVGVCMHLQDDDKICSTHRGHGHCIAKGCDVKAMMLEIFGKRDGLCKGKGGSMHIADLERGMLGANAIVGGAPPLAIGAALSSKVNRTGTVAVAFIGDGASSQGTTFEALNMAVVLKLPVIFVFENNGYGEGTGHDYAVGSKDISGRASGFGLPAVKVDGYDFFAVYDAMAEAVQRARGGDGPSVIETQCTRFYGHFVGDPEAYRGTNERQQLQEQCDCLKLFRARVIEGGYLQGTELDKIDTEVEALMKEAVALAKRSPPPEQEDLLTDVYVNY